MVIIACDSSVGAITRHEACNKLATSICLVRMSIIMFRCQFDEQATSSINSASSQYDNAEIMLNELQNANSIIHLNGQM